MVAGSEMLGVAQEAGVSLHVVRSLVETAERAGVPRTQLLSAAKLDPSQLGPADGQLSRSEVYQLCEAALDASTDPTLGLRYGDSLPNQVLNVVSHLVTYAATLRQGFDSLFRFSKLLTDTPGFRLIETDGRVSVRCLKPIGASLRVERLLAEMTMAGIQRLFRSHSSAMRARQASFAYPTPPYAAEYERIFGAARFDQPHTEVVYDSALMDVVSPCKDEDLHRALRALAERRLMRVTHCTPYSVRVREFMIRQGAPQRVSMRHAARELGISVRSLRRRLSDEGTAYGEITSSASRAVATQLIANSRFTIQETAYAMGFTDVNAFHRAFKRWTGTTPTDFRERALVGLPIQSA